MHVKWIQKMVEILNRRVFIRPLTPIIGLSNEFFGRCRFSCILCIFKEEKGQRFIFVLFYGDNWKPVVEQVKWT